MKNRFIVVAICIAACFSGVAQTTDSLKNTLTVNYNYYHFDKQFTNDWQIGSLEYKRKTSSGAFLGRVNYGNRLQQKGWQFEGEAYPILSKKVYAYAGFSYATKMPVFPKWRSGAS